MNLDTPYAAIRAADRSDHDAILGTLASAFDTDPLAAWLFPDPAERTAPQAAFHRSLLDHPGAESHLAGDGAGAAIWLHLQAGERLHDAPAAPPAPHTPHARLLALGEALALRHPTGEPHLYLAVMGVAPHRQGRGTGTALLRHRLERADRDGISAYLEASSPRSRDLYRRHGFTELGAPVRLADAPPLYPMRRPPAPRHQTHRPDDH